MRMLYAEKLKPGDKIIIKKTGEKKTIKTVEKSISTIWVTCTDKSKYNHIQFQSTKTANTYKKDSAINCCPNCGGIVNIVMDIPYRIILANEDGESKITPGYDDKTLLEIVRRQMENKEPHECYCDNCDTLLTATPRKNSKNEYIITKQKTTKLTVIKDKQIKNIAMYAAKIEDPTKNSQETNELGEYVLINNDEKGYVMLSMGISKIYTSEGKIIFNIYIYKREEHTVHGEKRKLYTTVETHQTKTKTKKELVEKIKEIIKMFTE